MRGILLLRQKRGRNGATVAKISLLLCAGSLFCCLVFRPLVDRSLNWEKYADGEVKPALSVSNRLCDPSTLPASIQLHCQMYRKNVIAGSLCSPLCDLGHICDVRSTYGHAHKEVMVADCEDFCKPGHTEQAVLKHDEVYAASEGYAEFYRKATTDESDGRHTTADWVESLSRLLHRHLPNSSFTDRFLTDMLTEDSDGNFSSLAYYTTFTQLFRQKEFVLFQAYSHTGVFPRIYGYCGPLYLVEFCDPILKQDRHEQAFRSLNNPLRWNEASSGDSQKISQHAAVNSQSEPRVEASGNAVSHFYKTGTSFINEIIGTFLRGSSENTRIHSSSSPTTWTQSQTVEFLSIEADVKNSGRERVHVVDLNPEQLNKLTSVPTWPSWHDRVEAAIKIFQFLEHLERGKVFPEHIHLCDPKLEHFAIGRDDGKLKLIDGDLLLFDFNMATESSAVIPEVDTGACAEHADCSDVMCTGWCWKETGRCMAGRRNNNLQGVCENVFLRPSLEYGDVFSAIPTAVYDDVMRLLCVCATNVTEVWKGVPLKMPSAYVRQRLVRVFEETLTVKISPDLRIHRPRVRGSGESDFLFDFCKSFEL